MLSGELAPATGNGIVVGVTQNGKRRVFVYGTAKEDSIYEIGSVTKTFTGLMLAQMVKQGKVELDEPVRLLLPTGVVAKPDGPEITLVDLSSQHSGLPRMPDNFKPANMQNPYADYTPDLLYAEVKKLGVAKPANSPYGYSNLGVGLLGQALAVRAGSSYEKLLETQITGPLGLRDTVITLSSDQKKRFLQGHDPQHHEAHEWDLDALAGAGAIRSTATDMLTYLDAQLHPEHLSVAKAGAALTLPAAIALSHELRIDAAPGMKVALGWHYFVESGSYWHNGGTGGFNSYILFNPKQDYAIVVLLNEAPGYADRVAQHVEARLQGKQAISLGE
jgi:CubicO group peptidase (beta-lactamase class C family)